ncbi:MAG: ammonium transporter, partial [Alphaproteobacteria bacterium]|nr:ammonium transporter [Alphaproteobacteria bacterium]
ATASLTWMVIEWLRAGKPTSIGLVTGAIAGLATITPASGYIGPVGALIIGVVGGFVCFYVTGFVKQRLRIDDSLDVFAVHGVGGMVGSLLVAILTASALGGVGYAPDMTMGHQLIAQATGIAAAAAWSVVATFVIIKLLAASTGLRVSADAEREGLDLAAHGERAYDHG